MCDRSESKQNKYLPGSKIPIYHPNKILSEKPDLVIIFPWNISNEVINELDVIRSWGGKFVVTIPELEVIE